MEPTTRARVRAAILALVIAVHGWLALPLPNNVSEARLRRPDAREELGRWQDFLARLGVERSRDELVELTAWGSRQAFRLHRAPVRPIRPLLQLTGTGQGWPLFAFTDAFPRRLEIHARVDGEWGLVFRRLDPDFTLLAPVFRYRRVRGVYDGSKEPYDALVPWVAEQVFAERPDADAVRIRVVREHVARPSAPQRGPRKGRKQQVRQVRLVERE